MTTFYGLTVPALQEAIFKALTSPPLPYVVNNADGTYGTQTLPPANVVSRSVWLTGANPPTPLIAFSIESRGPLNESRLLAERKMLARFWVVSDYEIEARFLYEAVRGRIHLADQENTAGDLSRAGTSTSLALAVRECLERTALPPEYDKDTGRWYVYAAFDVTGV